MQSIYQFLEAYFVDRRALGRHPKNVTLALCWASVVTQLCILALRCVGSWFYGSCLSCNLDRNRRVHLGPQTYCSSASALDFCEMILSPNPEAQTPSTHSLASTNPHGLVAEEIQTATPIQTLAILTVVPHKQPGTLAMYCPQLRLLKSSSCVIHFPEPSEAQNLRKSVYSLGLENDRIGQTLLQC